MPTTTWNLPGGHRITGVPTPTEDFTPTFQEWMLSTISPNLYASFMHDESGESAFYVGTNLSLLSIQAFFRPDSFAALRGLSLIRYTPQIAAQTMARDFFVEHGALGEGTPQHQQQQALLNDPTWNQLVSWVHHQLR